MAALTTDYDEARELKFVRPLGSLCTFLCLVSWWFAFGVNTADAQEKNRILVVNIAPTLERAVEQALKPWAMQTLGVSEVAPMGDSADSLRPRAVELSLQYKARVVVWISDSKERAILWVYDSRNDEVVLRTLADRPPYDEVSAASVALSIKTIVLHREVDPTAEAQTQKPKNSEEIGRTQAPERTMHTPQGWIFESQIMARHSVANDDSFQSRLVLGAGHRWPSLSLALLVEFGPGRDIDDEVFQGRYNDIAVRAQLGYQVPSADWVLEPLLSVTGHRSQLEGMLNNVGISETRINPSLDLGLRVGRKLAPFEIGFQAQLSGYARSQRYLVQGEVLLDLPAVEIAAGLFARLTIP